MVITAQDTKIKPGYKQTEVGVIPEDWEVVLLDSVAKRGSGHTPDKKHPEYWDGDIKWLSLRDSDRLDALYIDDTAAKITPAGIANSSAILHPAGTVVLSRDAGVGKSAITTDTMAVSQHFIAWQCGQRLNNHFLYYWLQAEKPEFERIAMGNTIKTIGLPYFRKLEIPLPVLDEQHAIATALSDVDALITSLDKLIAKKRDVKQATMQQLLTGRRRLPGFSGEWEAKKLGEITEVVMGQSPVGNSYNRDGNGYPLINGPTEFTDKHPIKIQWTSQPTKICKKNDILLCVRGSSTGRINIANDDYCIGRGVAAIRAKNGLDARYITFQVDRAVIDILALTTGSTFPNIDGKSIRSIEVPLPSFSEQTAIAAVLSDMDAEIAALEQKRDKTRALKQGMMQELLTGKTRLVTP